MDEKINQYIESKVLEVLQTPHFSQRTEEQKSIAAEKITDELNTTIFDTLVDHLTLSQLDQIKDLTPDDPQMEAKIEEFASQIPNFAAILEETIDSKVTEIKNSPTLLD